VTISLPRDGRFRKSQPAAASSLARLAPACLGLLALACQTTPPRPVFDYAANLGLAVRKAGHDCLYIPNVALSPGQRVEFVTVSTPQTAGAAEIVAKADDTCKDPSQSGAGVTPYSFKVTQGEMRNAVPAFAIANFTGALTTTDQGVTADLEGDRQQESFRSCTSTEGVHLTVWKGKPLEGIRKWHYYYYLGYDVTPDCTENETRPDAGR
jgi:hypothetical protein